jgi:uncharacterized protein YcbX
MYQSMEARIVAIDAVRVFVATQDRTAAFQRDGLPAEWWRKLRLADVNQRLVALIARCGVPVATPFDAVPLLSWPDDPAGP